jgi:hypothetical protein
MFILLMIGLILALGTVLMSYWELIPWFKAVKHLNTFTDANPTFTNQFLYMFRFISTLKYAWPVIIDLIVAFACGFIGLAGGVIGALIALMMAFSVSAIFKIHRHWISPKFKNKNKTTWKYKEE